MSIDVAAEAVIARDRTSVAAYAMEAKNDPVWISGISEAEVLSPPPVGKGSTVRRVASFLGRRIEYVMEVAELDPGARIVMRSVKSPFPMRVTYTFDDADGGTLAMIRVEGEAGRLYWFGGSMMARVVRRSISKDIRTLKSIMESLPPAAGLTSPFG